MPQFDHDRKRQFDDDRKRQLDDDQKSLAEARAAHSGAQDELFHARQRLERIDQQLRDLARTERPNAPDEGTAGRKLAEEKRQLTARTEELRARVGRAQEQLTGAFTRFDEWADPRDNLAAFNDDIPVLLFPLRIETRFKSIAEQDVTRTQLWVRVFPDECLVDTFEATLTDSEVGNAAIFWREYFHAAGVESAERAAWRGLVSAHGSGRATWIFRHFRPLNPLAPGDPDGDATLETRPQSIPAGEVLLVIAINKALTAAERSALTSFWAAV